MILFRVRQYGSAEWTEVSVRNGLETDEDSAMEETIADLIEDKLDQDGLHAQRLSQEGVWEDLE